MYSISFGSKYSDAPHDVRGFSLIELLVSISIVVIIAAIVLARQDAFNAAILLRNQSYDIALALREAQLSAVSVQGDTGNFREIIGIYFTSDDALDENKEFIVFRDSNENGFYDAGTDSVVGLPQKLDPRFEVREIRVVGDTLTGDEVTIIFVRPNFDARFFEAGGASGELAATSIEIDVARVGVEVVAGDAGTVRTIEVTSTGQIAVQ